MTRDQVKDIVFRTFTDVIADDEIEITEDSGIMDDLDMDSIEMQEVFSDLEEEFVPWPCFLCCAAIPSKRNHGKPV